MRLAALLSAIREAKGPVTGIDLAQQLGVAPASVAEMLVALRASGQLAPEVRATASVGHDPAPETCASSASCSMSCPGPEECSLVIDLNVTGLEIRTARS